MTRPRWCQHAKPHRPHRWLLARRVQECPGVVGPPADAAARSGLRPLPVMTAPADDPLLVRCRSNPEPHVVDDHCRDIYEAPAVEPVSVPPPVDALLERDDDLTGESARTMDELAELIDDWDQCHEGWRAIRSKAYALWASGVAEGRRQRDAERQTFEYAVRVDRLHPTRKDQVGDVLTHFGQEKSRLARQIWDGWTSVRRSVGPWEEFEDDGA